MAYDMRLMSERFFSEGMVPEAGDVDRLTKLLGCPLRTYRDFVVVPEEDQRVVLFTAKPRTRSARAIRALAASVPARLRGTRTLSAAE